MGDGRMVTRNVAMRSVCASTRTTRYRRMMITVDRCGEVETRKGWNATAKPERKRAAKQSSE